MLRNKIILHLLVVTISLVGALVTTAVYGKFKHDRYYKGTIDKVQQHQIKLSISMLEFMIEKKSSDAEFFEEDFRKAFYPVRYFMPVKVFKHGKLLFQYSSPYKSINNHEYKKFKSADFEISFGIYGAPPWFIDQEAFWGVGKNATFWRWIGSPAYWFTNKNDYIHVPFIAFFLLIYSALFALAYRFQANYFGKKVLATLEEIKKHQAGDST